MTKDAAQPQRDEIVEALIEADSYLSLIAHRYRSKVGIDLAGEMLAASGRCRDLSERIKAVGIKHGRRLTEEDWNA